MYAKSLNVKRDTSFKKDKHRKGANEEDCFHDVQEGAKEAGCASRSQEFNINDAVMVMSPTKMGVNSNKSQYLDTLIIISYPKLILGL